MHAVGEVLEAFGEVGQAGAGGGQVGRVDLRQVAQADHLRTAAGAGDDGLHLVRREVLAFVDNFQWNWQINYVFAEEAAPLVPKGTMIVTTAWHDNTENNPYNPDPNQWVGWGDRTVDEMAHNWVDVTYLGQEEYERMVAERNARAQ